MGWLGNFGSILKVNQQDLMKDDKLWVLSKRVVKGDCEFWPKEMKEWSCYQLKWGRL